MKNIFLILFTSSLFAADLPTAENEVREFIKLKKEIVQAKNSWDAEKSVLESELKLLRKLKADLIAEKEQVKKDQATILQKVKDRKSEQKFFLDKMQENQSAYDSATLQLFELVNSLPFFLQKKVNAFLEKSEDKRPLSQKLAQVFAILNEIYQTSEKWNLSQETIVVGNEEILADVLFAGIATGYAVTADNSKSFIGKVENGKWNWRKTDKSASQIRKSIKAFKNGSIDSVLLPFAGGAEK